jgi:hypothetical protein
VSKRTGGDYVIEHGPHSRGLHGVNTYQVIWLARGAMMGEHRTLAAAEAHIERLAEQDRAASAGGQAEGGGK